jgi:hypothetical protein
MTDTRATELDRTISAWLTAPMDSAPPDGILARSMADIRTTPQRPGPLARALGTPASAGLGVGAGLRARPGRVSFAVIVAIAALVALVAAGVVGGWLSRPDDRMVLPHEPSASPSVDRAAAPSASPEGSPAASARPASRAPSAAVLDLAGSLATYQDLGFRARPFLAGHTSRTADVVRFESAAGPLGGPLAVVTVSVASTRVGVRLDLGPGFGPFAATSLDGLVAAIRATDGLTVERAVAATLGGDAAERLVVAVPGTDRATVVVAIHGDRIVLIQAHGDPLSAEDRDAADLLALLTFVPAFEFLGPEILSGGGVSITIPDGWYRTSRSGGGLLALGTGRGFPGGASATVSVDWASAGEAVTIDLGEQAGIAEVSGHDLASLRASVLTAFPGVSSTKVTIGGEPGWRFGIAQASIVRPLANLAITWHDGTAYVFEEHLTLDGSATGQFGQILAAVTFD